MTKTIVAIATDIEAGGRMLVHVRGRAIVVYNLGGEFFALLDRCPHQAAELSKGICGGIAVSDDPGRVEYIRDGEFVRCPWHGWEFDIRTGQSWCFPSRVRARKIPVGVQSGEVLVKGPYVAETVPVSVEHDYVVLDV